MIVKSIYISGKCSIEEDLVCVVNDLVEVDPVDADNEDQSCMPVSKKKRKRSKKDDQKGQKEKAEPKEKHLKKNKKTLKGLFVTLLGSC